MSDRALPQRLQGFTGGFLDVDRYGLRNEWLAANDDEWRKAA